MDYLPAALKASMKIPETVPVADAADIFIRWICREPTGEEPDAALTPMHNGVGVPMPLSHENNEPVRPQGPGVTSVEPFGISPTC